MQCPDCVVGRSNKEQHTDKCYFWDGEEFCDCGARYSNVLLSEIKMLKASLEVCKKSERDYVDELARLRYALKALLAYSEKKICTHDETYRGGVIWEICESCGKKWADDKGGKPVFKYPNEILFARKIIDGDIE